MVPTPVIADGLIFVCGSKGNPFLAFRQCGHGRHDDQRPGVERKETYTTDCATPLYYPEQIVHSRWRPAEHGVRRAKSGRSPMAAIAGSAGHFPRFANGADGRIYCLSQEATAVVLSAADGKVSSTIVDGRGETRRTTASATRPSPPRNTACSFGAGASVLRREKVIHRHASSL